jgi:alpha-mannosidase
MAWAITAAVRPERKLITYFPCVTLPVIDHELNFEFTGCYTSQSLIKRANRWGENYLEEAETLAAIGTRLNGLPYPTERLREGWLNVLFNQFHDILPGSGVRETREHAQGLFQEVGAITGAIKRNVGKLLASRINTLDLLPDTPAGREERALAEQGRANTPFVAGSGIGAMQSGYSQSNGGGRRFLPFVVYNPCAWTRSERVNAVLYDTDFNPAQIVAIDETGVAHPTQFQGAGEDWGHKKLNVAFDAKDIPALGYRTYLLCEGTAPMPAETVQAFPNDWIETPTLKIHLDRYHCGILELIDKRTGATFVSCGYPGIGTWEYVTEQPRGMTSWAIGGEGEPETLKATHFAIHGVPRNQGTATPLGGEAIGYRVEWHLTVPDTQSTVRVQLIIHALEPRLEFIADLDWREIGDPKRGIPGLRVSFLLASDIDHSRYETPFGSVERSLFDGEEVPTLRYTHIARQASKGNREETYGGLTLLQDSKYGHSITDSDLRMRVVRSSFDPDHAPEVAKSTIRYALQIHDTPPTPAELTRLGAAWNHPLLLFPANLQTGDAPASDSFVQIQSPNVVLSALKQAEDGNGLILRLVELNGEQTDAIVTINPLLTNGATQATLVDLMERTVDGEVGFDGGTLKVTVPAHNFATVKLV